MYANDPDDIPLADFEAAAFMPYDTDIPEGKITNKTCEKDQKKIYDSAEDADIPDNPDDALKWNAMKLTRIDATNQVKKMIQLVDDIAEQTIINSVEGEEMRTRSPLGMQMIMSK